MTAVQPTVCVNCVTCPDCGDEMPSDAFPTHWTQAHATPRVGCPDCGETWKDRHDFGIHWAGAHGQPEPCANGCGELIGIRGKARHEAKCATEAATRNLTLTTEAVHERIVDYFIRAAHPPQGQNVVIVVPKVGPPMAMRNPELAEMVGWGAYLFDASLVNLPAVREAHRVQRDRRIGRAADLTARRRPASEIALPGL